MIMTPGNASARFVHIDQSYSGARKRLYLDMPEEAEVLEKNRWAIINVSSPVWRATAAALDFGLTLFTDLETARSCEQ
jgi:hypothetical protein